MPDYKAMYQALSRAQRKAMDILVAADLEAEEIAITSNDAIEVLRVAPPSEETEHDE